MAHSAPSGIRSLFKDPAAYLHLLVLKHFKPIMEQFQLLFLKFTYFINLYT